MLPCGLKFGFRLKEDVVGQNYISDLRRRMDNIHSRVIVNIQNASNFMKKAYNNNDQNGR